MQREMADGILIGHIGVFGNSLWHWVIEWKSKGWEVRRHRGCTQLCQFLFILGESCSAYPKCGHVSLIG